MYLFIFSADMGAWYLCFEIITFLCIITNCYLLSQLSSNFNFIVPQSYEFLLNSDLGRFGLLILLEHLLFGIKLALMYFIDDVPDHIKIGI
jgi:hypothetical protein